MKPVKSRRASSVRNAAMRGPLAARSAGSSKDWKPASNMAAIYGLADSAAMLALRARQTARTVARKRGGALRVEEPGEPDPPVRRNELRDRRRELLERIEQDIGEDQGERGAFAKTAGADTGCMHDLHAGGDTVDA